MEDIRILARRRTTLSTSVSLEMQPVLCGGHLNGGKIGDEPDYTSGRRRQRSDMVDLKALCYAMGTAEGFRNEIRAIPSATIPMHEPRL